MKNILIIVFLMLLFSQETFAAISGFKTYTPAYPYNSYNRYNYNNYMPPHPPTSANQNNYNYPNRYWARRNYYNNNSYNYPYTYYPQRRSFFRTIGDFFSRGKMTGYTDSDFQYQNPDTDYYFDLQNGSSVKILD